MAVGHQWVTIGGVCVCVCGPSCYMFSFIHTLHASSSLHTNMRGLGLDVGTHLAWLWANGWLQVVCVWPPIVRSPLVLKFGPHTCIWHAYEAWCRAPALEGC